MDVAVTATVYYLPYSFQQMKIKASTFVSNENWKEFTFLKFTLNSPLWRSNSFCTYFIPDI